MRLAVVAVVLFVVPFVAVGVLTLAERRFRRNRDSAEARLAKAVRMLSSPIRKRERPDAGERTLTKI